MEMRNESLGLPSGVVTLVPHDPRWAVLFDDAAGELRTMLDSAILEVHHVGSTAVPGLCAKPILDLLVTIPDFDRGRALISPLAMLGYEFRPHEEIPDRHYFRRRREGMHTHHLSLAEVTSHHHRATLAFRDALRRDSEVAASYAALKRELAKQFSWDRGAYIAGKTDFISRVLARPSPH